MDAADAAEPFDLLRELFARERLGVLATHGPEHPYASLVAVRASDDLRRLYFSTTRATRKFHFLTSRPAGRDAGRQPLRRRPRLPPGRGRDGGRDGARARG